ncbi:hypothetical protein ACVWXO_003505 [Bradyrhizobium sp. LM2.7]
MVASAADAAEQGIPDLSAGKRLARHQGFIDLQFLGVEDDAIRRYEIPGTKFDNVPGDKRRHRYRCVLAVSNGVGLDCHGVPQCLGCQLGAMFLHDVQRDGQRQYGCNDYKAAEIATHSGYERGRQQHRDQRIPEALAQLAQHRAALRGVSAIGSENPEAQLRFGLG